MIMADQLNIKSLLLSKPILIVMGLMIRGAADTIFQFSQLDGGIANGIRHGLAMDEFACPIAGWHLVGVSIGDFDEISQDVVVTDLERADTGLGNVTVLQVGNQPPAIIA